MRRHASRFIVSSAAFICAVSGSRLAVAADDMASAVARARSQVENGSYVEALRTLRTLSSKSMPTALAVEAGLLETQAALVASGAPAAEAACGKAVVAAGYDPEVARDQSPKVRTICRAAAVKERSQLIARAGITFDKLVIEPPEVAWQPVRVTVNASSSPPWLRVVARVTASTLEGAFDLPLAPSIEGPLRATLDPAWIRPQATMKVELIPQDKFGDLEGAIATAELTVPASEAIALLGEVPSSATVEIDGIKTRVGAGGRVAVAPGHHTVALSLDDGRFASTSFDVKRGGVARIALSPQKPATARTLAWIATGTSVAALAVGGVLLLNAKSRRDEIEELSARKEDGTNLPATEYRDLASKESERKTFSNLGSGFMIGGAAIGVAAVTLWLWPDRATTKKTGDMRPIRPIVGPGWAALSGEF